MTQWNNWHYFDPISTYIFAIIVIVSTFPIVANCYYLLMEAVPEKIDLEKLRTEFQAIRGVIDVHDLHVWDLRPGKTLMIAHVIAEKDMEREVLTVLTEKCRRLKIYHSTFQVEQKEFKDDDSYILCHHDIH